MDNSKINQTELSYSCGAGNAKVNLYTGRLALEYQLCSIGIKSYGLTLSNVYNSSLEIPSKFNTYLGNKWKLNIQQYLYEENNKYYYIDGAGMKIEFEYLSVNKYFDTSGLGMQLTKKDDLFTISDTLGNEMVFENGKLIKTVSTENTNITKVYVYGDNDQIVSMYDIRKPDNKFTFEYNNVGLLSVVNVYVKNTLKYKYKYYYENGNLIYINKEQNSYDKVHLLYSYQGDLLRYGVYVENRSAFKFKYSDNKVTNVNIGVATLEENNEMQVKYHIGDDIYVGEDIYPNDLIAIQKFKIKECMESLEDGVLKSNAIQYFDTYRIVTNEMNLKFVYYLNEKGYTSSILEANYEEDTSGNCNDYMYDLRTLERMPGVRMLSEDCGNTNECINGQKSLLTTTSTKLSINENNMVDRYEELKDYREYKCANYINYVCSFWLKLLDKVENPKVRLTINEDVKEISFDNTAVNSWQEVRIPIQINDKTINDITLEFLENNSLKCVKLADMKLYDSGTNQVMIGDDNKNCLLEEVKEIIYNETNNINQEKIMILSNDVYITEKDLQLTYLHKFKLNINNDTSGYFPFFYNDCTKFMNVKYVSLKADEDNVYPLNFIEDNLEENKYLSNSRAKYFLQSYSPDGDVFTNQITYFVPSYNIDGTTHNCLIQKTEANLYKKGAKAHKESYILKCNDLKGKILLEQDEYGVQNIYKYDNYGEMFTKIITSNAEETERIEETVEFENDTQTIDDGITKTTNYFDENDNIYKTEFLGKNEDTSKTLTNEFTYDYFNNNINKITNNLDGNNYIKYDLYGRIYEVSPKKRSDVDYYGYKFKYDKFGDPATFFFIYNKDTNIIEDELITRQKQRNKNETIINTTFHTGQEDWVISNVIDKYGRVESVNNNGSSVIFEREGLDESNGAANISKMIDTLDGKVHNYKYNDNNNLIEYGYTSQNGDYLKVKKSSENATILTFKNRNNGLEEYALESEIKKAEEQLLSPRVTSVSEKFEGQAYCNSINYGYDSIGRIDKKEMNLYINWINLPSEDVSDFGVTKERYFYPNTNLIKNSKTKIIQQSTSKYEIDYNYLYNDKGDLIQNNINFTNEDGEVKKYNNIYTYNETSQLLTEAYHYIDESNDSKSKTNFLEYSYNNDGSLNSITQNGITKQYDYTEGRLSKIRENNISLDLTYDNLGNTLTFGNNTYAYTRGNLLSSFNDGISTTKYYYNGQGQKYKKELPNGKTITYVYDNEKLISERHSDGRELIYLYDINGVYGFIVCSFDSSDSSQQCYYLEKDAFGNVISLTLGEKEISHYVYDAFGNCTVTYSYDDEITNMNPIRWKGMYCELESNLYLLKNNTYSPELRQTLSMNYLDEIVYNSFNINNLYAYNLYSTNPNAIIYDEYNIASGLELTFEEEEKSKWQKFWDRVWSSWWGKAIAIAATAIALVITIVFAPCLMPALIFTLASVGVTLVVGGLISGSISANLGKGFWNGFVDYINENWAQTLAIEMTMYLVSFGVTQTLKLGTKCFIEGMLILTSVGLVKIEEIKVGDEVWSYNEETKEKELKKVKRLFRNKTKEWLHLTILNEETKKEEEIICTKNHRIYIKNKGWIEANEILENEEVLLYNNVTGKVIRKELEILTYEETTYNFEVEDNHNYYVSEECVLVHNECQLARNMKKAGKMKEVGEDAHHLFPQNFKDKFDLLHIDVDDANFGVWMEYRHHRKYAKAYNKLWKRVLDAGIVNDNNAMMFAKEFMLEVYKIVI